ncbi:MAG: phosphoglucosamine mutase, partial [Clostridiales bacterium]|nr:phosphoglucosamine mutase [Clostridiales bacterium]
VLTQGNRRRPLFVIGKDPRLSSDMLEAALSAGLSSVGADVIITGVVPTPAVPFLVGKYKADAGIMISASHNPYEYNGIKLFSGDGFKLPDALEDQIEAIVRGDAPSAPLATSDALGTLSYKKDAVELYVEHLKSTVPTSLEGLHIAVDCANGSASKTARKLFDELHAKVDFLFDEPNGININDQCGSTHLQALSDYVVAHKLDGGFAFDGDADRCLCVDENGKLIDGDHMIAICALDMKQRGKLRNNTVVGTILTNMGFHKFCKENDITFVATKVGDRYVLERMEMDDFRFGGEQSGHIIFRDFATTGDGQLTAIQLLCHMRSSGKPLSELSNIIVPFPQINYNIPISKEGRLRFYTNHIIKNEVEKYKQLLKDDGRVVVRVSGTEPLIRVMVEGMDEALIQTIAANIAAVIKDELGS